MNRDDNVNTCILFTLYRNFFFVKSNKLNVGHYKSEREGRTLVIIITLCGMLNFSFFPVQNNKDWVTGWNTFRHHWSTAPSRVDTSMPVELNPLWSHNNTSCLWEVPSPIIITQTSTIITYMVKSFPLHVFNHVAIIGQILLYAILCTNCFKCIGSKKLNYYLLVGANCNEFCLSDFCSF
jgi:hypothetical protein